MISWKRAKAGSRGTASEKLIGPRWRPSSKRTSASRNWWPSCLWRMMSSPDIIEVVQEAIEFTGQPAVPVEPGPALLTDHGPGFLSRILEEFLMLRAMQHIVASPFHPQTNGKLERYHRTAKAKVNLFVYHSPEALGEVMESFVNYYNSHPYHEALKNVPPAAVYYGRREEILARREEVKQQTLAARRAANLSTA